MGVDCKAYIKRPCRLEDIAEIIALSLGNKGSLLPFRDIIGAYFQLEDRTVVSFSISPGMVPDFGTMTIRGQSVTLQPTYHFTPTGFQFPLGEAAVRDCIMLSASSTPIRLACFARLVNIHGGYLIPKDSDDVIALKRPRPKQHPAPEDGAAWDAWQKFKANIQPLTDEEINAWITFAAYLDTD